MDSNTQKAIKIISRELTHVLIIILITTSVTYFFAGNRLFTNFFDYSRSFFYGFSVGWTIWKGNQILGYYLEKIVPWDVKPVFALVIHLISSIVFTLIDIIVVNFLVYKYIFDFNPINDLRRFIGFVAIQFGIAMLITTIYYIKHYFVSWRKLVLSQEKLKQDALSMQYETLKSYVNPHFLFNSLSVLSSLVEKDTAKSQEFIKQLSDIYRYVLEQKDKELVPLKTELEFIKSYINLFKIRYGENLVVELDIIDDKGSIIPLSLQILLENAVKHNIISSEEPLIVTINREADYIIVKNKLQTRKTIDQNGGLGLHTISKRYEYFTKRPMIVSREDGYFTVKIPIIDLSLLNGYR
jgi:hypothetical protein